MPRRNCQACGEELDGPATFPIPGVTIARLCVQCRQDFQRWMMMDYPELTAKFDKSIGDVNRARSGHPSMSGLSSDHDLYIEHVEMEQLMIRMWDTFLEKQKKTEDDEQGQESRTKDGD